MGKLLVRDTPAGRSMRFDPADAVFTAMAADSPDADDYHRIREDLHLLRNGLWVRVRFSERSELTNAMTKRYTDAKPKTIANWVSQIWPFAHEIKKSDLVVLPLRLQQRAIQIGEVTGDYHYEPGGPNPYYHWRPVKWIGEAVPRANFGKDLLYTFGAFMTICRVQRYNAEARIAAMRANVWKGESIAGASKPPTGSVDPPADPIEDTDLEDAARDQIAQLITARFKSHGLTRLVEAILKAQGYTTYRSGEGGDGGADILAGTGPLGLTPPSAGGGDRNECIVSACRGGIAPAHTILYRKGCGTHWAALARMEVRHQVAD